MDVCNPIRDGCGPTGFDVCRGDCVGRAIETVAPSGVRTTRPYVFCRAGLRPNEHSLALACERGDGAVPFQIRDAAENAWIRARANDLGMSTPWLHALRAGDGTFTWYLGSRFAMGYQNWSPGEPNDAGGNEDYVQMYPDGRWNDLANTTGHGYVCVARQR
jgi:hypothetical protein